MGRLSSSLALFKSSWSVLRQDRELLVLPVLSGLASLITVGLFAYPVWASMETSGELTSSSVETSPITFVLVAFAYFILAFVTIFFNAALVHAANERMSGGDPTVGSALAGAASRINRILPWALLSATVSQIIRAIQERAGIFGRILGFLGGVAWAAATFLVLPILVLEDVGPIDAIKQSAGLLRKVWGEGAAGNIGLAVMGFVAAVPFVILGVVGALAATPLVTAPAIAVAAAGLLSVVIVMSALSVIYQTALYRFATNQVVESFDDTMMRSAFRAKD